MADEPKSVGQMLQERQKATMEAIEAAGGTISHKPGEGLEQVGIGAGTALPSETPYAGTKPAQVTEETKPLHPVAAGLLPRFQRVFQQQGHDLRNPTPESIQAMKVHLQWQLDHPEVKE